MALNGTLKSYHGTGASNAVRILVIRSVVVEPIAIPVSKPNVSVAIAVNKRIAMARSIISVELFRVNAHCGNFNALLNFSHVFAVGAVGNFVAPLVNAYDGEAGLKFTYLFSFTSYLPMKPS